MSMTIDIRNFHEKFGLAYDGGPRSLDSELSEFRIKFMQEELDEYKRSCESQDLVGQFDALIDLVYVALGTAYLQGLPFDEGWAEVQRCNMAKVRAASADQSKRGWRLDIIKGPDWTGPEAMLQWLIDTRVRHALVRGIMNL